MVSEHRGVVIQRLMRILGVPRCVSMALGHRIGVEATKDEHVPIASK